ncbi:MAG: OadG family transporter subunit [Eubacteriales bacterium]|nr:OadG family transporter subunit [Eubacteriales bacterium]
MPESMMKAWTVLITGFIVVFAVLILLIGIIKIYSTIVYKAQNRQKKDKSKDDDDTPKGTPVATATTIATAPANGVSSEVLAAIAAAVDFIYGPNKVRIKNIKKSNKRSVWGSAGVVSNTRPF